MQKCRFGLKFYASESQCILAPLGYHGDWVWARSADYWDIIGQKDNLSIQLLPPWFLLNGGHNPTAFHFVRG